MSNVIGIAGEVPRERHIYEMRLHEVGYTVPWAYDQDGDILNEDFPVHSNKGGTLSLRVECTNINPGCYSLTFEEPVYRAIGIS